MTPLVAASIVLRKGHQIAFEDNIIFGVTSKLLKKHKTSTKTQDKI